MITEYKENCVICGKRAEEVHHLVFGRGIRELADKDGLTCPLCRKCHHEIHYNSTCAKMSKIIGQLEFEKNYIDDGRASKELAREQFRKRYGRSYL